MLNFVCETLGVKSVAPAPLSLQKVRVAPPGWRVGGGGVDERLNVATPAARRSATP
jgi:hypothetical protein